MSKKKYNIGFLFLFDSIGYIYKAKKFAVYLPEEILTNVFLRLGVKSLLRCKSVSKTWLSVILNPHFVKSQLHRALMNPTMLFIDYPGGYAASLRMSGRSSVNTFPRRVRPRVFEKCDVVSCSYNGIICLCDDNDVIYLWNPSIKEFKKLPPAPRRRPLRLARYDKIAFGYDSISDDYKVLKMLYENPRDVSMKVYLYSTNTDSWRRFQDPIVKKLHGHSQSDVVVNGVLYIENGSTLISFDLHQEVFGLVPLPGFIEKTVSYVLNFEGSVAIVFKSVGERGIYLWTLDGVSGQMQWTKKFRINVGLRSRLLLHCYLGAGQFFGRMVPDHDFFLHNILYDYETEEATPHGVRENVCATVKYTKTLVSLKGFEPLCSMPAIPFSGKKRSRGSSVE